MSKIIKLHYLDKPDLSVIIKNIIKYYGYKGGIIILYKNDGEVIVVSEELSNNEILRSLNLSIYNTLHEDTEIISLNDK